MWVHADQFPDREAYHHLGPFHCPQNPSFDEKTGERLWIRAYKCRNYGRWFAGRHDYFAQGDPVIESLT